MLLLFVSISLQMRILKTTLEACAKKSDIVYMEQLDETRGSKKDEMMNKKSGWLK